MLGNILYSGGNITYRQGTQATLKITAKDSSGVAIDATGWTIKMVVQKTWGSNTTDCIINGVVISGAIHLYFLPETLSGLRMKDEYTDRIYQIEATDSYSFKHVLGQGTITVYKDIVL